MTHHMRAEVHVVDDAVGGPAAALIVRTSDPAMPDLRAWGAVNPTARELAQLDAIADRINGVGTPLAAQLDLRPRATFDWSDKLMWAWVGFMICGAVQYVLGTVGR